MLNLGHTFAHALEAASDYALPHGRAVALGLTAALELSGLPEQKALVEEVLAPKQAPVDADRTSAACAGTRAAGGQVGSCCSRSPGRPVLACGAPRHRRGGHWKAWSGVGVGPCGWKRLNWVPISTS